MIEFKEVIKKMIIKVKIKATHESKNSDNYTFDPIKVSHYKGEMTEEEIRGQKAPWIRLHIAFRKVLRF